MDRPKIKDPQILDYVEFLEKKLRVFETSPYANTYMTIRGQIDSFNEQLTIKEPKKITLTDGTEVTTQEGKIDLFGSKDEKEFERSWKYMLESFSMNELLDKYRAKMTPKEIDEANKIPTGAAAERYIFDKK